MIEAFANHLSSHLGRHLFYWATTHCNADTDGLQLRITDFINKFHGPLERGVQILDHLLTLEEEDFNDHWGSAYAHNYEPEIANAHYGNQEQEQQQQQQQQRQRQEQQQQEQEHNYDNNNENHLRVIVRNLNTSHSESAF
uniref:Uncharacterized protein n=1 Tax=Glossina austeni TaxID=7395 RepID=A0A1A9V8P7_GLOAU